MPEPPTAGMIRVLGRPPGDPAVLRQAGAMGEIAFYPFLSGRDNLRAAARRCGIGDRRVDVVLGQVGLAERAGDAVAGYSYGMRQRLGGSDQISETGPDSLRRDVRRHLNVSSDASWNCQCCQRRSGMPP